MAKGSLRGDLVQTGVVAVAWVSTGRQGLQINIDSSHFFCLQGTFPQPLIATIGIILIGLSGSGEIFFNFLFPPQILGSVLNCFELVLISHSP